jgi:tetratricopeptide (TPR) repeat protein
MNRGHSSAWDQDWRTAAQHYRSALEEIPGDTQAASNLGLAYMRLGDLERALECYRQAAELSPQDPMPMENIARIFEQRQQAPPAVRAYLRSAELYLKSRNAEKAIQNWKKALHLQPGHLAARTRLALVYERMGRKDEAAQHYLTAAGVLQRSGQADKAVQVVEHALKLSPQSEAARSALNRLHNGQDLPGIQTAATAPLNQVIEPPAPDHAEDLLDPVEEARQRALAALAEMLFDQPEENPGRQITRPDLVSLARGVATGSLSQAEHGRILAHVGAAVEAQTRGDAELAAAELERAMDLGLDHPAVHFDAGLLLYKKTSQRALRYLQFSMRHPDYDLASHLMMARILSGEGKHRETAMHCLEALRLADLLTVPPEQADELYQAYEPVLESHNSQPDDARLRKLSETIYSQLMRRDWRRYLGVARLQLEAQTERSQPAPLAEILLQTNSSQVVEGLSEIRDLIARGKFGTALEEAYEAIQAAPTYLPLHIQICEALLHIGRVQDAVNKFILVADLYTLRGETKQAVLLLKRVLSIAPMDIRARNKLIELLVSQGQVVDAIQQYMELAGAQYQQGELKQARQSYQAALNMAQQNQTDAPFLVEILHRLADIDLQRVDLRQAIHQYERIRMIDPENMKARQSIVELNFRLGQRTLALGEADQFTALLERFGSRERAIEFMLALVREYPREIELGRRLARLYAHNGQLQQAVEHLDHLADTLVSSGRPIEAAAAIKEILALEPENAEEYRQALEKLQQG